MEREMPWEPSNPRARNSQGKLTLKQRRLIAEFEEIAASIGMDYWNIFEYREDGRTAMLEVMKRQLITGEIISRYTFIDELLSVIICHFYFTPPKPGSSFARLWRTKKLRLFTHYFVDEAYLLTKMRMVREIKEIPVDVRQFIERLNALRNALAHSYFPENRRQYKAHKKVIYQGTDIFTKEGVATFLEDVMRAQDYLFQQAFGVNPADARAEIEAEAE
jgi:hypothetical protein